MPHKDQESNVLGASLALPVPVPAAQNADGESEDDGGEIGNNNVKIGNWPCIPLGVTSGV